MHLVRRTRARELLADVGTNRPISCRGGGELRVSSGERCGPVDHEARSGAARASRVRRPITRPQLLAHQLLAAAQDVRPLVVDRLLAENAQLSSEALARHRPVRRRSVLSVSWRLGAGGRSERLDPRSIRTLEDAIGVCGDRLGIAELSRVGGRDRGPFLVLGHDSFLGWRGRRPRNVNGRGKDLPQRNGGGHIQAQIRRPIRSVSADRVKGTRSRPPGRACARCRTSICPHRIVSLPGPVVVRAGQRSSTELNRHRIAGGMGDQSPI